MNTFENKPGYSTGYKSGNNIRNVSLQPLQTPIFSNVKFCMSKEQNNNALYVTNRDNQLTGRLVNRLTNRLALII